jgi:DNA-directed RNA polymerase beta subunit
VGGDVPTQNDLQMDVGCPSITLDNGRTARYMFPNEASLRDLTYAVTFQADISIKITRTERNPNGDGYIEEKPELITMPKYPLFRIPILLRSKVCATHTAPPSLLTEMGECRSSPFHP